MLYRQLSRFKLSTISSIFHINVGEFNSHSTSPDLQGPSDHASLLVYIIIEEEFIQEKKLTIVKNSEKEKKFINKLRNKISCIEMTNIKRLEEVI